MPHNFENEYECVFGRIFRGNLRYRGKQAAKNKNVHWTRQSISVCSSIKFLRKISKELPSKSQMLDTASNGAMICEILKPGGFSSVQWSKW